MSIAQAANPLGRDFVNALPLWPIPWLPTPPPCRSRGRRGALEQRCGWGEVSCPAAVVLQLEVCSRYGPRIVACFLLIIAKQVDDIRDQAHEAGAPSRPGTTIGVSQ